MLFSQPSPRECEHLASGSNELLRNPSSPDGEHWRSGGMFFADSVFLPRLTPILSIFCLVKRLRPYTISI